MELFDLPLIFSRYLLLFSASLNLSLAVLAQGSNHIQLIHANTLDYNRESMGKVKHLIGDVQFRQNSTLLNCDSAYQYEETNKVEAFGRVYINHQDSIRLYGEKLTYDGNTRKAKLERNARMTDNSMTLTTDVLDFDLQLNTGNYTTGGTIISGQDKLTSQNGYYFSETKETYFKKNVKLVNPEYTINTDTLRYNTVTKTAYFFGPTTLFSNADKMYCEKGQYDTRRQLAMFSKNAVLVSGKNMMAADSIYYEKQNDYGRAFMNVELFDTSSKITVYGDLAEMAGKIKQSIVTRNAVTKQYIEDDSMYLFADTIWSFNSMPGQKPMLKAFHHAVIIKSDLQAVADSLVYLREDSTVTLYTDPLMWSGVNQISSDTIRFFLNNNKLDSFILSGNAFMISREGAKQFNQVKGKVMHGQFIKSKIRYLHVFGNGQSIYYAKEDSGYLGVNVINCSEMEFFLKNNRIERSNFITDPDAVFHPLEQLKPEELRLKGFKWQKQRRPRENAVNKRFSGKKSNLKKTFTNTLFSQ